MTTAFNSASEIQSEALRAAQIIESVVGHAWATDASGNFTYVTPAALSLLDITLDELNSSQDEGSYGWKRVIHPDDYDSAAARWRRCLQTGEHYDVEHRMLRGSGAYRWCRSSGQPLRDGQGRILAWYGTVIDGDGSFAASRRFADATNSASEEKAAPERPHSLNAIHPDDRTAAAHAAARAFWTGVTQVTRHRQRQADGSYRWTETRSEPGYSVSVDIDDLVTDREPPVPARSVSWEEDATEVIRSARIVESIFGNGWAFDATGRWIYLHPFAQNSLGVTLEDLNAALNDGDTAWKRLLHPDDYDQIAAAWRHCLETGDHFNVEFRFRRATGNYAWARTAARPVRDGQGRLKGWFGIALDIDVYKKTMAMLRDRERELSQLVDMVPSHIWRLAPDGEPTFFNKRMVDFIGKDVAGTIKPGMSRLDALIETVHPEDAQEFTKVLTGCLASGERFSMRYRLRRADGAYHWMSSRAEPLRDQDGRILQWYGLCHDIDDQVKAEEALLENERLFRQLVETLPAMIDCATPDGEPVYRSQQLSQFLGYQLEEMDDSRKSRLAATLNAGVHPDDLAGVKENYAHSLATGEPYARRHRLRRFDGEYRWVETRAAAMRDAQGNVVQWNVICLDIDREIEAQQQLRVARERLARASQAASLAELSASIAHEVNQPLAAVVANSYACQRWLTAEPPNLERAQKTVERIIRDANAAAEVVSRIRALFRQSETTRTGAGVDGVISEAIGLMAEEAAQRRVRLKVEVESDLPRVWLDRVQIQQVLINIIRNGLDAMDSVEGNRVLNVRVRRSGNLIQTEIADQGRGLEHSESIFEPFFTTKEQGMGMGLAICRSIVEAHGGRLWAEKNEPQGARFIFTLPIELDAAP